ncbi:hypothetical protein BH24ACT11_BH24ACT11_09970 [soil metagenome]
MLGSGADRRGRRVRAAAALTAGALLAGCAGGISSERAAGGYVRSDLGITVVPAAERADAPAVAGESVDGGRVALSDHAGQPVVLNVWFADCPPCRAEADDLVEAQRRLGAERVAFLGVNIRDDRDGAAAFQRRFDIDWPSIYDPTSAQLLGFRDNLPSAAVPTTWVIDSQGRVGARVVDEITSPGTLVDLVEEVEDSG